MGVLVGKKAPDFIAKAVVENKIVQDFSLSQFRGKNVVLFFYPLDFTFVCPTELHAFQEKLEAFEKRNTQVIGCSVDSPYSHYAWVNTPKSKGGIEGITYPIVSDINKTIARDYDVLIESEGVAYRGLFLIDGEGTVRHQVVNDLPLGRSVDEAIRIIDALLNFEQHGEVCPANWQVGKQSMVPTQEGLKKYFAFQA
ncbi:peroxiredoxin [Parachlamydia sp. AcF125]|uniref:peroxiredoxin n=1 Tax=Parachlamydia sp. AcF125 TaxID=2795736 RepID=UPI001BCA4673|nr:peroxiredoxin [Parachlamydia sp. AcF125]MBS4167745.1 Alkyl hydroperoxide reductase C [Parachlamydia sp. AcF125]